jgi:hypothetical protein
MRKFGKKDKGSVFMFDPDNIFFWPVIVLVGVVVIVISARFLFRVALFVVSLLIIWYALHIVGLLPTPVDFFKKYEFGEKKQEKSFPAKGLRAFPKKGTESDLS